MQVFRVLAMVLGMSASVALAEGAGAAIERVIRDQMAAFEDGDLPAAFSYASPQIRRLFGTPDRFGQMVQDGYPMVWRPGAVRMGELRESGGTWRQIVMITDLQGRMHALEYEMLDGARGWVINGVRFVTPPEVGA